MHHYFRETAKGLYPSWRAHIDAGIAPAHMIEPYRQILKQMLGPNAELDLSNHDHSAIFRGQVDPKTKMHTLMSHDEWRAHVAQTPSFRYAYTRHAHERAQSFLAALHASFGQPAR